MKTPLELIESELSKYKRALFKSIQAHINKKISDELHMIHVRNLEPKIIEFSEAVEILKKGSK